MDFDEQSRNETLLKVFFPEASKCVIEASFIVCEKVLVDIKNI